MQIFKKGPPGPKSQKIAQCTAVKSEYRQNPLILEANQLGHLT